MVGTRTRIRLALLIFALLLDLALAVRGGAAGPGSSLEAAGATAPVARQGLPPNRIVVELRGLRDSRGSVRCALFASADGFPTNADKAVAGAASRVGRHRAACVFTDIAPGTYAIAVLHDENNNGRMDYNFLGIPKEGYGFSNDASVLLGPPSFKAASFPHAAGVTVVSVPIHYLLAAPALAR